MTHSAIRDTVIIGGGLAGLSAAIYLGRALRDVLVVDAGRSMAHWEPEVQNYLGFPEGISGESLLERGRKQAEEFGAVFAHDEVLELSGEKGAFEIKGREKTYRARRVLLATGIFHIPPDIPGVSQCLGRSLFFCKDCDGYRVQNKQVAVLGNNDDAVEYALAMVAYSPTVVILTNGSEAFWSEQHQAWVEEYQIPVHHGRVVEVEHEEGAIHSLRFESGRRVAVDCAFTMRGDIFHNSLARALKAEVDDEGQLIVNRKHQTSVPGLYAAGCVTPANCQMIIAAGEGAGAAQAINRDLFEESLATHGLQRIRNYQLRSEEIFPKIIE